MSDIKLSNHLAKAGKAKFAKYGREHYAEMGRKGAAAKKAKNGENYQAVQKQAWNKAIEAIAKKRTNKT